MEWKVENKSTGEIKTYSLPENTIYVPLNTQLEVTIIAKDEDGGIKMVTLGSSCSFSCIDSGSASSLNCLGILDVADFSHLTDFALKGWFLKRNQTFSHRCSQGKFNGGSVRFDGDAYNFSGGKVSSVLTVLINPE